MKKGNAKCKNSHFDPLFEGLRGNAQGNGSMENALLTFYE